MRSRSRILDGQRPAQRAHLRLVRSEDERLQMDEFLGEMLPPRAERWIDSVPVAIALVAMLFVAAALIGSALGGGL